MDEYLHMRTIFVVVSMVGLILLLCMIYVARARKTYPGFNYWMASSILYFLGNFLIGLRGLLPDLVTIIIANTLITLLLWLIPYGLAVFAGRRHPLWPYLSLIVIAVLLFSYFTYVVPHVSARIIVQSSMFAAMTIFSIVLYKRIIPPFLHGSNLLLGAGFVCGALWSITRIVHTLFFEPHIESFLDTSVIQRASIIIYCGLYALICIALCILNFQRVEHDLVNAHEEVTQLKGILPICTNCKKIRDDQGYWNQVESYIRAHSDATFTHSICPECLKLLYPQYVESE